MLADIRNGKTTFGDMAYRAILNAILSHQLKPGDPLRSRGLTALLGISRTPIDRALERLAGEGLVEFKPGEGPFVFSPTVEEMLEMYDARTMLEVHCVQKGIENADDQYLADLARLAAEYEAAFKIPEADTQARSLVHEADRRLHEQLIALWPNHRVRSWYKQLNVHVKAYLLNKAPAYRRQESVTEHYAIFEALNTKDLAAAIVAVESHGTGAKESFLSKVGLSSRGLGKAPVADYTVISPGDTSSR